MHLSPRSLAVSLFALFLAVFQTGCSTSPLGRSQLTLVPDSQMNTLGTQSFQQLKQEKPVATDAATVTYVRCVALSVARRAHDDTGVRDWEVVVFQDNSANAFALPGGKIGVHTGLLSVAKTPGQLAAVLGHEVGHVIARHGNERVSQGLLTQTGLALASVAIKDHPQHGTLLGLLGVGAQVGVLLPHSRGHESEADLIGQRLMAEAGYDPRESVDLWRNMAQAGSGAQPPEFLSTHPSHATRISKLEQNLSQVAGIYDAHRAERSGERAGCCLTCAH